MELLRKVESVNEGCALLVLLLLRVFLDRPTLKMREMLVRRDMMILADDEGVSTPLTLFVGVLGNGSSTPSYGLRG